MIDTYGDRIYCIFFDNTHRVMVGYKDGTPLSDISLETIGGKDFVVIQNTSKSQMPPVKYKNYHPTEYIQWIGIMDEEYKDYRVDPLTFR